MHPKILNTKKTQKNIHNLFFLHGEVCRSEAEFVEVNCDSFLQKKEVKNKFLFDLDLFNLILELFIFLLLQYVFYF